MNIAEGLKAARERAGMSLDDVASNAGLSFCEIRDFELDEYPPTTLQLLALSRVLDFEISWPVSGGGNIEIILDDPIYLEESGDAAEWRHGTPCSPLFGVYWHYYRVKHARMRSKGKLRDIITKQFDGIQTLYNTIIEALSRQPDGAEIDEVRNG